MKNQERLRSWDLAKEAANKRFPYPTESIWFAAYKVGACAAVLIWSFIGLRHFIGETASGLALTFVAGALGGWNIHDQRNAHFRVLVRLRDDYAGSEREAE